MAAMVVVTSAARDTNTEDEEDDLLEYDFDQPNRSTDHLIDPFDMLGSQGHEPVYDGGGVVSNEERSGGLDSDAQKNYLEDDPSVVESDEVTGDKLMACRALIAKLQKQIESEQQKSTLLLKKLNSEGNIDMIAFYERLIHHLWNVMELEEAWDMVKDDGTSLIRRLTVYITRRDLDALHGFLQNHQHLHQVDEFVANSFTLENLPDNEGGGNPFRSLLMVVMSGLEVGKNIEVWLYLLCVGFLTLAGWAVLLFVRDIQRELRWGRVIVMMAIVIFFICCLWHWRHLVKKAEAERHARMMQRGFTEIPEECKPGAGGATGGVLQWIKINFFRSPDVCEKYFEELMIDPTQEISPAMVISETLSKFFLQPLQHIGKEMAKLITNFYGTVPIMYHIPATVIFLVLLLVILFYIFGYGIDFPLWMGGIRPMARPQPANSGETDHITREAIAQLNRDRERFLEESRHILTDITRAAGSVVQGQGNFQPLMQMSTGILENQLEHLISRQINLALTRGQETQHPSLNTASPAPGHDRPDSALEPFTKIKQRVIPGRCNILTVTSTPLRSSSDDMDVTGGAVSTREEQNEMSGDSETRGRGMHVGRVESRRGIRRGVSSGVCEANLKTASYEETNSEAEPDLGSAHNKKGSCVRSQSCGRVGLPASTDGVHHRIQGLPKRNILPPKMPNRDGGSTSSLEEGREDVTGLNERRNKKPLLGKIKKGHSEGYMDEWEGWRARLTRLGRKFHSTDSVDREACSSPCSTNTNTSTHSLYQDIPLADHTGIMDESAATGITSCDNSDFSGSILLESPNGTATSEDFYSQVKNLLEESANSSQNESYFEDANSSLGTTRRKKNHRNNKRLEEKELSASGVKFLKSMEKELTTDDG
ncbi:hypothetical protein Pmani_017459 [Petrolisthes manimaculis]|uniref:Chloride channel CLIC-like protein 1 n=1 Tax=Petrolisthes manimaculis TaxID=1843537 RepID=A0AAE1PPJ0_9EUCA|nr:hypothetical protein Pmani_017459 [Petrolisthes manimaculis]